MIQVAYHPIYIHPLPEKHRFPMEKYSLLKDALLRKNIIEDSQIHQPKAIAEADLLSCTDENYWQRLKSLALSKAEIRKSGFPLSQQLVERELIIMQGSLDCANYALENGAALNIAGGTHHANAHQAEGFCLLNDLAIGVSVLLRDKKIEKALIIDLDVHQGNGTADIFEKDARVFTFSAHGANNFPLKKSKSDLDIAFKDGTSDELYLSTLERQIPLLMDKFKPDIIAYQSGVDVLSSDKLGKLSLSKQACKERDNLVYMNCAKLGLPVFAAMGGGYSPKIAHIVDAHTNTFEIANHYY